MIGASPLRKEDQRLLRGGGRFVDDLTRDGALHLGVVRSAESSARLIKVVTAGARALPGVVLAWSAADLGEIAPTMPSAYGGTQKGRGGAHAVLARDVVAAALGLPVEEVRVVVPDVGGGFGPKGPIYPEEILVAAAAHRLGRPVKWVESRRENLACMGHDREQNHDVRIGFARDGTIVAIDGSFVADVGAYPLQGDGLTANTVNHMPGPYRVPHYRNTGTSVVATKTLNAAYRAAGRPEAAVVMERLMDLGARRLGLDPAEIRRRNFVRPAEMPYRPGLTYKDGVAVTYDPGDFPAAFEKAP